MQMHGLYLFIEPRKLNGIAANDQGIKLNDCIYAR